MEFAEICTLVFWLRVWERVGAGLENLPGCSHPDISLSPSQNPTRPHAHHHSLSGGWGGGWLFAFRKLPMRKHCLLCGILHESELQRKTLMWAMPYLSDEDLRLRKHAQGKETCNRENSFSQTPWAKSRSHKDIHLHI